MRCEPEPGPGSHGSYTTCSTGDMSRRKQAKPLRLGDQDEDSYSSGELAYFIILLSGSILADEAVGLGTAEYNTIVTIPTRSLA